MSGHNKWSQIKHKKAKEDGKRAKAFTKLIKEITMAAKEGGGNPDHNPVLRSLLEKAKYINMPVENSVRAIKKGTGELPGVQYTPITYEGYGPFGVAVIVDTLTDNKNRTVATLRHLFSTKGGSLAETGAVNWMFEKMGVIRGSSSTVTEDQLLEQLLEHNVRDIQHDEDTFAIFCDARSLDAVKKAAQTAGLTVEDAQLEWVAQTTTDVTDNENMEKVVEFLSALEDVDDVQNVYANLAQ
jgi:YebC/PmpR family DNA-binding regulatory protein